MADDAPPALSPGAINPRTDTALPSLERPRSGEWAMQRRLNLHKWRMVGEKLHQNGVYRPIEGPWFRVANLNAARNGPAWESKPFNRGLVTELCCWIV